MALSATSGSGEQTSTQNPQTSAQASGAGGQAASLQPGTTSSLLANSNGGVPLAGGNVTAISLNSTPSTQTISNPPIPQHHANPVLVGLSAGLFVIAILMFWLTSRSEKNTTI